MTNPGTTSTISRYISAINRWRLWVLAIWVALVVGSGIGYVSEFRIDNSVAIWFLEDDPELEDYRRYLSDFGQREWTYIWLKGETVFSPEFLRDLRLLRDQIEALETVTRVVSLTEAGGIRPGVGGELIFEPFYSAEPGELVSDDGAVAFREKIRGSPKFEGRLVPANNDRFTIIAVQNANGTDTIEPYRIRLIDEIRYVASAYPAILDFGIAGTAVINSELNRAAKRDMLTYYALIGVFVLVGGGLALRCPRDLVVLCAVVLGTIFPIMGGIALLGLPFNLMTVMLPTLLVTVSVSYLIHFISEFHAERCERLGTVEAISATFGRLLRPGLWTSLTTAVGFASLAVSPVAPIRQIGVFAASGIALAWVNTITIAPALLGLLWEKGGGGKLGYAQTKKKGWDLLGWLAIPRPVLATLLGGAMLTGAAGLIWLEADTDYVKFFRPGGTVRKDYAQLDSLGMPGSYLTLTVRVPEEDRFSKIDRHLTMRGFEKSILALPGVLDIQSADTLVEQLDAELEAADPSGSPPSPIDSLLVMFESGRLGEADEYLAEGGRLLQLRVMTGPMSTRDILAFRSGLEDLLVDQPRGWEFSLTGTNVLWANMDAYVVRTQLLSIGITAAVLLILLPLAFRSVLLGVLGFAVSFVPVLCTLGLMAWLGLPVNIATCILGGVVIGLAVDDTIFYLSRVREGMLMGLPVGDAARRATWTTGRAMIKTSLILTGGFLTMAASDFMPSVFFGMFFAFSILVALLADLIALPVLLRLAAPLLRRV